MAPLFTKTCTPPKCCTAYSNTLQISSYEQRSAFWKCMSLFPNSVSVMSTATTTYPLSANIWAITFPIPPAAPVTIAMCFL